MNNNKYKKVTNKYGNKVLMKEVKLYLTEHQIDFILKSMYENDCNNYHDVPNSYSTGVLEHIFTKLLDEKEELSELNNLLNK
jgi:hypothetical protein